jgi:lipopolysaccharide/colanic/teichoic acid biosynthesis glycosyltransferase
MRRLLKPLLPARDDELTRAAFGASMEETGSSRGLGRRTAVKRGLDITLAAALLVLLALPLLLIALAIKLDSRGPVFYRSSRVGFGGRPLTMLKFRKMHHGARGVPLTAEADPRFTRVGAILARTRLDELPQLWDVLRGRMSIVGPRPEAPEFVALHADAYERILSVRPGITGLSQLAFAEEHSILDQNDLVGDYVGRILPQKIGLDTLYAREYRLGMDLRVLTWTAAAMVMGRRVSVHRQTGALTPRRRPQPAVAPAIPISADEPAAAPGVLVASPESLVVAESPAVEPARAA